MTRNQWIALGLALLTSYAFGRWSAPVKTITETKIIEVEKKTKDSNTNTNKDTHKETTVTETIHPDGTREVVTKTTEDTKTDKTKSEKTTEEREKEKTALKEVERSSSKVTISALAGVGSVLNNPVIIYGGSVSRPILGPIALGAFGLTNGVFGLSIGLVF